MSYWRLYYHFIWGTKDRQPLITSEIEPQLYKVIAAKVIAAKVIDMGCILHAVGGVEDHIHLVVSVPPRLALADFISQVKGSSSHFVSHVIQPDIAFAWQGEYGVVSFGEKHLKTIVGYVKGQRQHHAESKLITAMERCREE
jgi:putative transposase